MPEYRIGKLKGRFVVTWIDGMGVRRRHRLDAQSRKEAESEALDVARSHSTAKSSPTIAELWDAYVKDRHGRPIAATMKYTGKAVLAYFGSKRYDQLVTEDSRQYLRIRSAQGIAQGSVWTELGHLRSVLTWSFEKARMIPFAPHIERPPKPAPKERYLLREEIATLLAAECEPHIRVAILVMLTTAARVGAVLDLTWDRVDFERGQINFRLNPTQPRKGRAIVPINDRLRALLVETKRGAITDYVIEWGGEPIKSIRNGFVKACQNAKLKGVTPHVLRHTAGVHMAEGGMPMQMIAQYMGHSSTAVTERVYARYSPNFLRGAAEILNFSTLSDAK